MENRSMGILDREPGYMKRLADYILSKEGCRIRIFTFADEQEVASYLEQDTLDLLLVSQSMASAAMQNWEKVGQLVFLNEGDAGEEYDAPSVYKFQSSDGLFREVMTCYAQGCEPSSVRRRVQRESLVTGVYSPVKRCGKTIFSLVLALVYAEQWKTLLISLDEFCTIEELKAKGDEKDLADVMFLYHQNSREAFQGEDMFSRIHGLDYIPPVAFPWDLRQIRTEELADMVLWAAQEGGYERIVIDIGEGGDSPLELLEVCDQVYVPFQQDFISDEKIKAFEHYMETSNQRQLLDKMIKIDLPQIKLESETAGIESLLWSPVEQTARNLTGIDA